MDISQQCGWCMSSAFFFFFFNWLKRNGDKCGSEQVLKCGWKWKLSDVLRVVPKSLRWEVWGNVDIFVSYGKGEQCIRSSGKPSTDRRKEIRPRSHPLSSRVRLTRSLESENQPKSSASKMFWAVLDLAASLIVCQGEWCTISLAGFFWESEEMMHDFNKSMLTCLTSHLIQATSCDSRENSFQVPS